MTDGDDVPIFWGARGSTGGSDGSSLGFRIADWGEAGVLGGCDIVIQLLQTKERIRMMKERRWRSGRWNVCLRKEVEVIPKFKFLQFKLEFIARGR